MYKGLVLWVEQVGYDDALVAKIKTVEWWETVRGEGRNAACEAV